MGKKTPKVPTAPDPVVTAAAQTKQNIETANAEATLNRSNQITPWGQQTWTAGPAGENGVSQWTQTVTLSPEQQKLMESDNRISQSLADLGERQLGTVSNSMGQPFNYNSAPSQVTGVQAGPTVNNVQEGFFQSKAKDNMPLSTSASYGGIQNDVDMSKVPDLVGGADLRKTYEDAQKAAYGMQSQYLNADYGNRQKDLENKLIQQGVLQGSEAWDREMQTFGRQRTFDYNNAFNNSFDKGLSAQGQIYNQGLASNQNAYSQALNNANFHNSAQAQGFGQSLANAQLNNAAAGQKFGQNLANANLNNTVQNDKFTQGLANANLTNSNQNQLFNQGVTNANLQNQGRTQAINEANYLRQQPLNELNALRTGAQVSAPQFGSTPQAGVNNTDIASMYQNQYQGQLNSYNAKVAQQNQTQQNVMNLGLSALLYSSDRRLKENIEKVGMRADGLALYQFDYKPEFKQAWGGGRFEGVMADEVAALFPHAVINHPDGYQMVDYGALNG